MIVTGRDGYVWARTIELAPKVTANAKAICNGFIDGFPRLRIEQAQRPPSPAAGGNPQALLAGGPVQGVVGRHAMDHHPVPLISSQRQQGLDGLARCLLSAPRRLRP
jgi:hypothetical protein